jgi:hypothetical protein
MLSVSTLWAGGDPRPRRAYRVSRSRSPASGCDRECNKLTAARASQCRAAVPLWAVAPIYARPLQRLRCRPFVLFKLPTVYQSLPISILGGRAGKRIALSGVGGGRPCCLRRHGRRNLRPSRTDGGYGYGGRYANQRMLHHNFTRHVRGRPIDGPAVQLGGHTQVPVSRR